MSQKLNVFVPIRKVDEENRLVYGVMTEEVPDKDDEIIDYASSKPHFEKWSSEISDATNGKSLGNVRVMHGPLAAGKLTDIKFMDEDKRVECCAHIVDDNEWNKVKEGVYTGFSVGGSYEKRWPDPLRPSLTRFTAVPVEVSLVDNPCVPTAHFTVVKAAGVTEERMFKAAELAAQHDAMIASASKGLFAKFMTWLAKSAQEAGVDGFQRPAGPEKPTSGGPQIEDDSEFDDGFEKRDFSREKRKELAESGAALPDGSYPIVNEQDLKNAIHAIGRAKDPAKAKRHIISRAQSLGATHLLPEDWEGSSKKAAEAIALLKDVAGETAAEMTDLPDDIAALEKAYSVQPAADPVADSEEPETLEKSMQSLRLMVDGFDHLRWAQRELVREGKVEGDGGDEALAARLGEIASDLSAVIAQKSTHEGEEAVAFDDADDLIFRELYGISSKPGAIKMTKIDENELSKRARKLHHEHLEKAEHHFDKAAECHKCGMAEMAKLAKMHLEHHEAHKAAGGHEFDHGVAARLLAKAHKHFGEHADHHEMGRHHLAMAKSAHAAGGNVHATGKEDQGSQRVEDKFHGTEIPEGELTEHSLESLLEGHVPDMPDGQGPYGKGVFGLLLKSVQEAAFQKGRADALEKLPAGGNRPRMFAAEPVMLDKSAGSIGEAVGTVNMNDPEERLRAGGRAIGHMITHPDKFGKSVLDPEFAGQAGGKR